MRKEGATKSLNGRSHRGSKAALTSSSKFITHVRCKNQTNKQTAAKTTKNVVPDLLESTLTRTSRLCLGDKQEGTSKETQRKGWVSGHHNKA